MRILLVTSDLPTPTAGHGGGQLTFQWANELSDLHRWSLLSFLREEDRPRLESISDIFNEIRTVPSERSVLNRVRRAPLLLRHPFAVAANYSKDLLKNLRQMIAEGSYDCVQFENFHLGQYSHLIEPGIPRILVLQDIVSDVLRQQVRIAPGLKKYYYYREWKLSRYWEKWYAIWSGNVFLMSLKDKRAVESWDVGCHTYIMPPLLDNNLLRKSEEKRDPATILFVGAMHRPGNQDAALRLRDEIMPEVRRRIPEARCLIVGANPPLWIKKLSRPDFIVTGTVEEIGPYLASASLLAVPLRIAGGIILKIIQAMTAGCPVVASRAANAGIGAAEGSGVLIADRSSDFAAAIISLLKSPEKALHLGRAGREWVARQYNREKCR
ncbi:MAG: glycosyltransferase family 4 protein, partial [Candidatus Auribacterota bacterium]|nr:glycosyltransferase family 4 protein [Candidatus Auribacterota bacterium]